MQSLVTGPWIDRIGIDSGAEIPIWPNDLHAEVMIESSPESLSGVKYWGPGDIIAPSIADRGICRYIFDICGGTLIRSKNHIADVR